MLLPQSYLLIEIVPIIFLHVKIVIVMYGYSGVAGATPLHSTSPPGMLTVYPLPYPTLHVTHAPHVMDMSSYHQLLELSS